jgi:hypothetical protein
MPDGPIKILFKMMQKSYDVGSFFKKNPNLNMHCKNVKLFKFMLMKLLHFYPEESAEDSTFFPFLTSPGCPRHSCLPVSLIF